MVAYRIAPRDGVALQADVDEDGEFGAGQKMMFLLNQMNALDVVIVVTRWYGGTHLGGLRFKYIAQLSRDVLEADIREDPTYPLFALKEDSDDVSE